MEGAPTSSFAGEYGASGPAVDATHRAASCFYGVLSVLQLPLTQFVAARRAKTPKLPPRVESEHANLAKAGLRMQLSFLRDHWTTHFSSALPATALADARSLLQVLQQLHFTAAATVKTYQGGMAAAERLLGVAGASANSLRQVHTLKTMLGMGGVKHKSTGSLSSELEGKPSGNRRVALTQQAKQIMDANEQADGDGGGTADVAAYDRAIELLDAALELAATPNQRCRILAMRSECQALCGRTELASEDGEAALATQCELGKWTAMKLVGVFKTVERWNFVAATCNLALRTNSEDEELLQEKALALKMIETPSASTADMDSAVSAQEDEAGEANCDRASSHGADIGDETVKENVESEEATAGVDDDPATSQHTAPDMPTESALLLASQPDEPQGSDTSQAVDEATSPSQIEAAHEQNVVTAEDGKPGPIPTKSYLLALAYKVLSSAKKPRTKSKRDSKELRTAKLCIDLREFEEAVFWIDKEISRTKKPRAQAHLYVLRAQCHFELKEFVRAVEDAGKASLNDSTIAEAHRWLSEALLKLGRLSEAHSACSAGRKADPSNEVLKTLEKEISRRSLAAHASCVAVTRTFALSVTSSATDEDTDQVQVELPPWKTAISIGLGFMQAKNLTAAERAFSEAWTLIANEEGLVDGKMRVLGHRAGCRLLMKQYESAISDAREGLLVKPQWVEGHRLACKGYMGLELWRHASKECEAVLREVPHDTIFRSFQAEIKAKMSGIVTGPSAVATKTIPWQPQLQGCIHAGLHHVEQKRYADAEACFTKAHSMLKKFKGSTSDAIVSQSRVKVFGHRARCRLALEKWQGAAEDARAAIQFQADWTEGYRLLCRALMGASQWQKALDACQHVLSLSPQDVVFAQFKVELEQKCAEDLAADDHEAGPSSVSSQANLSEYESQYEFSVDVDSQSSEGPESELANEQAGSGASEKLLEFASQGSLVAQRYLAAQRRIAHAQEVAPRGNFQLAIEECGVALKLWPHMEIPGDLHWAWILAGWCSSVAWGGPMPYYHVQAFKMRNLEQDDMAERQFWREAVEKYPEDPELQTKLAWVLFRGEEINAALEHAEKALELAEGSSETLLSTSSLLYLLARCAGTEVASSEVENVIVESAQSTREARLLEYVQRSPVDDEWMPHALYTLGVLSVAKGDYLKAKHFYLLAQEAESRRGELGLFPAIDEDEFLDKRTLDEAVS